MRIAVGPDEEERLKQWGDVDRTAKYVRRDELRDVAVQLRRHFENRLGQVVPTKMAFLLNLKDKPRRGGKAIAATVRRTPAWVEVLTGLTHVVEFFVEQCKGMSSEQLTLLMYHELCHITETGALQAHDVEEFGEIVAALGRHPFADGREDVPNILDVDFDWSEVGVDFDWSEVGLAERTLFDEPGEDRARVLLQAAGADPQG